MSDPGDATVPEGCSIIPAMHMDMHGTRFGSLIQSTPSNRGHTAVSERLEIHDVYQWGGKTAFKLQMNCACGMHGANERCVIMSSGRPESIIVMVNGKVIGVLNDYDLASLTSSDNPLDAQDGKVRHLYCHDMESFVWVFVWICFQYKDRELQDRGPLDAWVKVDASGCAKEKCGFFSAPCVPRDMSHEARVLDFVNFLGNRQRARDSRKMALRSLEIRLSDAQADLTVDTCQIAELEQKIEQVKLAVVEQSDDAVFREFAKQIGFHTNDIDAIVSKVTRL
ncbi:hypothetical protein BU15DRAFT_77086 [Melanogaster broomeanus]|nr:hypothetical protein BU15DRAFT_77086 [Melanogaster broomeanus]